MGNKTRNALPSADPPKKQRQDNGSAEAPPPSVAPTVETVIIEVPIGHVPEGAYIPLRERVELRSMTRKQGAALRRLTRALQDGGRTLNDGTRVWRDGHAIRWLLEQLDVPQ